MTQSNTFLLDGQAIDFTPGDSIMDAALRAGAYIPHLCHNPDYPPHGSCRICVVKTNDRLVSACTYPASANISVENNTRELMNKRRTLLQLLFVEGNHICPGCEKSGDCQLQALAYYCEMLSPHFRHFFPLREVDASHPDFIIDYNRCINCELCVRASQLDGKSVFLLEGRGMQRKLVINGDSGKLGDSAFSATDRAASVCPVGAILPRKAAWSEPVGTRRYDRNPINLTAGKQEKTHD